MPASDDLISTIFIPAEDLAELASAALKVAEWCEAQKELEIDDDPTAYAPSRRVEYPKHPVKEAEYYRNLHSIAKMAARTAVGEIEVNYLELDRLVSIAAEITRIEAKSFRL
jgi:hypothetical protein